MHVEREKLFCRRGDYFYRDFCDTWSKKSSSMAGMGARLGSSIVVKLGGGSTGRVYGGGKFPSLAESKEIREHCRDRRVVRADFLRKAIFFGYRV